MLTYNILYNHKINKYTECDSVLRQNYNNNNTMIIILKITPLHNT